MNIIIILLIGFSSWIWPMHLNKYIEFPCVVGTSCYYERLAEKVAERIVEIDREIERTEIRIKDLKQLILETEKRPTNTKLVEKEKDGKK